MISLDARSPAPPAATPLRPIPRAPWVVWAAALLLALVTGVGIVLPKVGAGLLAGAAMIVVGGRILKRPFVGILVALCVFPFYPVFRALFTAFLPSIPLSGTRFWPELVLCLMFAGIVVRCIVRRECLRVYGDDFPVLIFLAGSLYGIVIGLVNRPLLFTVFGFHFTLMAPFFYFAVRWVHPSAREVRRVLMFLGVTYVVLALLSLLDYMLRPQLGMQLAMVMRPPLFWQSSRGDPFAFWRTYARMQSLLYEENAWAALSTLISLFCLASLFVARPPRVLWALFSLSTLCLFLSMSRGGIISWFVGVFVLLLLRGKHRPRILFALLILGIGLGMGGLALREDTRVIVMMARLDRTGVLQGQFHNDRADQWENGWNAFLSFPSGMGIGTAGNAAVYCGLGQPIVADGHYIKVAAEQGVPGLLTLGLCLLGTFWVIVRHLRATRGVDRVLGMAVAAYLSGLCVEAVVANVFDYDYTPSVLWILFGLFVARRIAAAEEPELVEAAPDAG